MPAAIDRDVLVHLVAAILPRDERCRVAVASGPAVASGRPEVRPLACRMLQWTGGRSAATALIGAVVGGLWLRSGCGPPGEYRGSGAPIRDLLSGGD